MELVASRRSKRRDRVMAAITHVCSLEYVAKMMDEDLALLEAIVWNDDNLIDPILSITTKAA